MGNSESRQSKKHHSNPSGDWQKQHVGIVTDLVQQQVENQLHPQQYHNGSHSPSGGPAGGSQEGGGSDDLEYTRLRQLAHQEAEARGRCYDSSKEAYSQGNGAKAKQLSNQGHEHDRKMKQYNQQAADYIFEMKNRNLPPDEIDLHGLFVQEALKKADLVIAGCIRDKRDHLTIIVGKGNHSV
ncbi:hypothetical protein BC938DRAFT_476069, partial [Jimgerdemannia flammicorona]